VFGIPWESVDDFDVYWSASPTSPGHLKIKSKRFAQSGYIPGEGVEPSWMNWTDEIAFNLRGTNPQILRIWAGHWNTPLANPSQPLGHPAPVIYRETKPSLDP
jgi:hypothetical protein